MPDVHIGIGSNIEPVPHLRAAVAALDARFGPIRCSDVYRSPAYGFSGDDFLNMVVACRVSGSPDHVERELYDIEYEGGRIRRTARYSSRTLDLDLLLFGAAVDAERRLPRADVLRYPFVLGPLAELAPDLRHPLTGRRMDAEWETLRSRPLTLERLGPLDTLT